MKRSFALLILSGLCLASPVAAQSALTPDLTRVLATPPVDYDAIAAGCVFGNQSPVVFLLADGEVNMVPDAGVFELSWPVDSSLNDVVSMAVAEGVTAGAPGVLYVTNDTGLVRLRGKTDWSFHPSELLMAGSWIDAQQLQYVDVDGEPTLTSVTANGATLQSVYDDNGTTTSGFQISPSGGGILDYTFLDFDQDGNLDVALLTAGWLLVYELDGTLIAPVRSWGGSVAFLATVPTSSGDHLAWATLDSSGDPQVRMLHDAGQDTPVDADFPVDPGGSPSLPLSFGGLAAGDVDGDGLTDLVLHDLDSHRAIVLVHQDAAQHFSATTLGTDHHFLHLDDEPGSSGAANTAEPIVADVDGDGQNNVVFALDALAGLVIFQLDAATPPLFEGVPGGLLIQDSTTYGNPGDCTYGNEGNCTEGTLNLAFTFSQSQATSYDYIEVVGFRQTNPSSPMESNSVIHEIHELLPDTPFVADQWIGVTIPELGLIWTDENHYFFRYRLVNLDTSGGTPTVTAASKSFTYGITLFHSTDLDLEDFTYLKELSIYIPEIGGTFTGADEPDPLLGTGSGGGGSVPPVWYGGNPAGTVLGAIYSDVTTPGPASGEKLTIGPMPAESEFGDAQEW